MTFECNMHYVQNIQNVYFGGLIDSLKFCYPLHLIWKSSNVKKIMKHSLILNITVFLFNAYYFYGVACWYPIYWTYFKPIFTILWELPCFIAVMYLNHQWGAQLLQLVCKKKYGSTTQQYPQAEVAYGTFLIYIFHGLIAIINSVVRWAPIKLTITFFAHSWLAAFYLFETRLIYKGYSLNQRITFLQRRWLYFLGYGTVWALMYMLLPYRVMYSLYYSLSNLMVLNTIHMVPKKFDAMVSLPIFGLANVFANYVTSFVKKKII